MPTYNRAAYLRETLKAVLGQTLAPRELIVWDDGSTDATSDICAQFGAAVTYRRQPNAGKSRALNEALKLAKSEFIWIVDDDDIPRPDGCQHLYETLQSSQARIAAGSFVRFHDDGHRQPEIARTLKPPSYWPDLTTGTALRHILEECFIFQPGMLVNRSCYKAVGGFREDLPRSIDYEMLVRLALHTPIAISNEIIFEQRIHSGNRGPRSARHAAGDMQARWVENDQKAFAKLKPKLSLDVFEDMFEADSHDLCRRAALLQRGCVFARRLMWHEAIDDFMQASMIARNEPLAPIEASILKRAVSGKYFPTAALEPEVANRFATLRRNGNLARVLAATLSRGMAWRIRKSFQRGNAKKFAALSRIAYQIGGGGAVIHGNGNTATSSSTLRERSSHRARSIATQLVSQ
ncbi:MAG: glycosyltransferase [Alphaproteobacteria bacterium]|nr:glycosyltransferase [Alphaproteobacteria bacterium]